MPLAAHICSVFTRLLMHGKTNSGRSKGRTIFVDCIARDEDDAAAVDGVNG